MNNSSETPQQPKNGFQKIMQNPFRYYRRAFGFTFCLSAVTNTLTAVFDKQRRDFLVDHPQVFFTGVLFKSVQFGLIFPAFYATALTHPKQAFYLGGGIEDGLKQIGDNINDNDSWSYKTKYETKHKVITMDGKTTTTTILKTDGKTIKTVSVNGEVVSSEIIDD
jgi:hypothetical protein